MRNWYRHRGRDRMKVCLCNDKCESASESLVYSNLELFWMDFKILTAFKKLCWAVSCGG